MNPKNDLIALIVMIAIWVAFMATCIATADDKFAGLYAKRKTRYDTGGKRK